MIIDELKRKRDNAVTSKKIHHDRMLDNVRAFKGVQTVENSSAPKFMKTNPTKARVNTIGARLGMIFKDNEEAFGLEPTPVTDGDPAQVAAAAEKMSKKIRDCLVESKFSSEARMAIRNHLVALGSMIVKVPVLRKCRKRRYARTDTPDGPVYQMQVEETIKPLVEFIDPFNWFPEDVSKVDDLEYCLEVHMFNKRQMLALKDQGLNPEAIDEIVKLDPVREEVHSFLEEKLAVDLNKSTATIDKYAVWEYHGILDPEDYEYAAKEYDFPPGSCGMVEAWFCGDEVLKVISAPFDAEYRVPYLATSYEDECGTLFGLGVAQLFSESHKVISKGWNAYQHNNSLSAGPQVIVDVTMVEPADGKWIISGPKIWKKTDPLKDVADAFQVINIENNSQQHLEMIDTAIRMGDDEISYPLMLRGEENNPNNATAAIIATNANNIITFDKGMKIDAQIINPMIHRLYWYFMEFDEDMEAKGDYTIKAKGADNILIKDLEQQKMMSVVGLSGNPLFAPYLNNYEVLKAILNLMDSDTDKLLKPQEEVDNAQQVDPRQVMMEKEVEIKQGKLDAQNRQIDMQAQNFAANEQLERERIAAEVEMNRVEAEAKVLAINVSQDTEQMKIAAKTGIEQAKLSEAQLAATTNKRTDAFFKQQELNIKAEGVNAAREEMKLKLNAKNKSGTGI